MATVWRRAMTALGLGPDEDYDDYDEVEPIRDHVPERSRPAGMAAATPATAHHRAAFHSMALFLMCPMRAAGAHPMKYSRLMNFST